MITRAEPETGARLTRGSASNSFAALAQSNRFRIVELLRTGPRSVNNIGERLRLNQSQVSMHLRVLKEAGLVDVRTRARQRFYELRASPSIASTSGWKDTDSSGMRGRQSKTVPSASRSDQGVDDAVERVRHFESGALVPPPGCRRSESRRCSHGTGREWRSACNGPAAVPPSLA